MLDSKTVNAIREVAQDEFLQIAVIDAMFDGCERGTDLWEHLEESKQMFLPDTCEILWGEELDEEDEDYKTSDALYTQSNPHDVICAIIDQVKINVRKVLLRES